MMVQIVNIVLAKQKRVTRKPSHGDSNRSQLPSPLLASELKFDKRIDIPNPNLQPDGTLTYTLFHTSTTSGGDISPSAIKNNASYPELEKLTKK